MKIINGVKKICIQGEIKEFFRIIKRMHYIINFLGILELFFNR
jgi:hypothetical protein